MLAALCEKMMIIRFITIALFVAVLVGCGQTRSTSILSQDGQVINQLKEAGSDLSKKHPIEFFIYASTKEKAEFVASEIAKQGFSSSVQHSSYDGSWLVLSTKMLVPNEDILVAIRANFEALASSVGGEYDGWGTPIVK